MQTFRAWFDQTIVAQIKACWSDHIQLSQLPMVFTESENFKTSRNLDY